MPAGWSSRTVPRILRRDPVCRLGYPGCLGAATEVHHLTPGVEDEAALAGVCSFCHNIETQRQAAAAAMAARRARTLANGRTGLGGHGGE